MKAFCYNYDIFSNYQFLKGSKNGNLQQFAILQQKKQFVRFHPREIEILKVSNIFIAECTPSGCIIFYLNVVRIQHR